MALVFLSSQVGFQDGSETRYWHKAPCTYAAVDLVIVDFALLHKLPQQVAYGQVIESKFFGQPLAQGPFSRPWTA